MSAIRDLDAERALLGAILLDPTVLDQARERVATEHFSGTHREIFAALCKLRDDRESIDEVTLGRAMGDRSPGAIVLTELIEHTPSAANWRTYARTVATVARVRRLGEVAAAIAAECQGAHMASDEDALRWFADAQKRLVDASTYAKSSKLVTTRELMRSVLAFAEERVANRGKLLGWSTGYADVDALLLGIRRQRLHVVAGKPGAGKTAFALNVLRNAARSQARAFLVSLEMSLDELGLRFLSAESRVPAYRIEKGEIVDTDFARLANAIHGISEAPILWPENPPTTMASLRAECQSIKRTHGLDLLIVDYLQLVSGSGKDGTREREVAEVSRGLKLMATELDIAVIALSQLNRNKDRHEEPELGHLRDSGAIEQDANAVIFLWADNDETETINWKIAKNRGGAIGQGELVFRKTIQRFDEVFR